MKILPKQQGVRYPELKPKTRPRDGGLGSREGRGDGTNGITVSMKWTLPPKMKPGRKPGNTAVEEPREEEEKKNRSLDLVTGLGDEVDTGARRKRQNREAQRAYRERKANRILELERLMVDWEFKCERLKDELGYRKAKNAELEKKYEETVGKLENENKMLRMRIDRLQRDMEEVQQQGYIVLNEYMLYPVDEKVMMNSVNNVSPVFEDRMLQETIEQFKPMKAVPLKRRMFKRPSSPALLGLPVFKKPKAQATLEFPQLGSTLASSLRPSSLTIGNEEALGANSMEGMADFSVGCGFCSDGSMCVCREVGTLSTVQLQSNPLCSKESGPCSSCPKNQSQCLQDSNSPSLSLERDSPTTKSEEKFVPGSCEQCQKDPSSKKFCKAVCKVSRTRTAYSSSGGAHSSNIESGDVYGDGFIPIGDAYKRIKQHMTEVPSSSKLMLDKLCVRGRCVELKSVDEVIRQMDRNLYR
ncbi:uncharacterized protein Ecym_8354 [Eremothecium cymbalariae DBVPG|uniref:BZIP domain-containing protein n=1 Tax=Eremothecium cymbalariae (strain CBS 270.75 / DBVPG 7215 / KCTC 17166 / NRRL Y-17582) TaxID=931890 RepID=G8JXQ3_ERECY|nr:Hypothetical protein Ecym_8354 [Eremothecium cymbalariae DBVPG\